VNVTFHLDPAQILPSPSKKQRLNHGNSGDHGKIALHFNVGLFDGLHESLVVVQQRHHFVAFEFFPPFQEV
jgi:hypothetical protein